MNSLGDNIRDGDTEKNPRFLFDIPFLLIMESLSIEQLVEAISNSDENVSASAASLLEKKFAELEAKPKVQAEKAEEKEDSLKSFPLSHKRMKELLQKE